MGHLKFAQYQNHALYPFTGGRACDAIIIFDAPYRGKPVIAPSRGYSNHQFTGGYDFAQKVEDIPEIVENF